MCGRSNLKKALLPPKDIEYYIQSKCHPLESYRLLPTTDLLVMKFFIENNYYHSMVLKSAWLKLLTYQYLLEIWEQDKNQQAINSYFYFFENHTGKITNNELLFLWLGCWFIDSMEGILIEATSCMGCALLLL